MGRNDIRKECRVCGDRASAFNHNGLSCQSCKMFFRRNIPKIKKLKCLLDSNCTIDLLNRSNCPKCRLAKCIAIGMRMNPPDCSENTEKLIRNILVEGDDDVNSQTFSPNQNINSEEENDLYYKMKLKNYFQIELSQQERELLSEIHSSMQCFEDESRLKPIGRAQSLTDAINLLAFYARRIIKFCKNIQAFRLLKPDDQLIILKPFYFEINAIRMAFNYDPENDAVPMIVNETGDHAMIINFLKFSNEDYANFYYFNREYRMCFKIAMENDPTIRDLIITILLFKHRDNISCSEFVNYEFSVYTRLLYRYLVWKHFSMNYLDYLEQAEEKYTHLMFLIQEIYRYRDSVLEIVFAQTDHSKIDQVMRETFEI